MNSIWARKPCYLGPWTLRVSAAKSTSRLALQQVVATPCASVFSGSMCPIMWHLGFWVVGIIVQVLGKNMIIRYLDALGLVGDIPEPQL